MNNAVNIDSGSGRGTSTVAPALAPAAWILAIVAWLFLESHVVGLAGSLLNTLATALLILPAPWLLWASWRMPRPQVKTYVAEGGALLTMLLSLVITVLYFLLGSDPHSPPMALTVILFAAAAVFVAAAWPLPGRRIAYSVVALGYVALGIGLRVPFSESGHFSGIDFMTVDELFTVVFLGFPVLGTLLQIAWWMRGKR